MISSIKVIGTDDFNLIIDLEDGRCIKLDMNFIKSEKGPVVEPLKNITEFKKVFIRNGIVTWPSGYDIDPYFLESQGILIDKTA